MDFAGAFLGMAAAFPTVWGDAVAHWPGVPVEDDGGSIISPGIPTQIPCKAQGDSVTTEMRADAGFIQGDIRILILALDALDTSAEIVIESGPHAGRWSIESTARDAAGIGWDCRGRRCL